MDPYSAYANAGAYEHYGYYGAVAGYPPVPPPPAHPYGTATPSIHPSAPGVVGTAGAAAAAAMTANIRNLQSRNPFAKTDGWHSPRNANSPNGPRMPSQRQAPNNKTGLGYGQWVTPGALSSATTAAAAATTGYGLPGPVENFPKKGGYSRNGRPDRGGANAALKRPFDATGKTPAMLLHELFKDVNETYQNTGVSPNSFRCTLIVQGKEFSMEASSKKIAKQRTAELVIRGLRPDIPISPYEGAITVQELSQQAAVNRKVKSPPVAAAPDYDSMQQRSSGPPPKKNKVQLSAVDSAFSVIDCLRKICLERAAEGPFNPEFVETDVTDYETPLKPFEKKKMIRCTLTFAEQNMEFSYESTGRSVAKDMASRQALMEMFNVTPQQIRTIMRRNIMGKAHDMPVIQTLYHVANVCHCSLEFEFKLSEGKMGIGMGAPLPHVCVCRLTDHTLEDKLVIFESPPCISKHAAKEYCSHELLRSHFDIDPQSLAANKRVVGLEPPCQKLQIMCSKKFKKTTECIKYEEMLPEEQTTPQSVRPVTVFKCKCIVNDDQVFIGSGSSKKFAKSASAILALMGVFKFNYEAEQQAALARGDSPMEPARAPSPHIYAHHMHHVDSPAQKLCFELSTFCRNNYLDMCRHYDVAPSTQTAAFFFLNEHNDKRLVSLGSSQPHVVSGSVVREAAGTSLIHLDPIVLAKRGLQRYLMSELSNPTKPNSILCPTDDGMYKLNDNLRLVLYANYQPNVRFSSEESKMKSLSTIGPLGPEPVAAQDVQTMEDLERDPRLRVHCAADKIFKWTHLGVQGSLLSTLLCPILLNSVMFGSSNGLLDDCSLEHSFFSRTEPVCRPVQVCSLKTSIQQHSSATHSWVRELEGIEILNMDTGKTREGAPSKLCKAAMFEVYKKLNSTVDRDTSYMEAKARAIAYNEAKRVLYEKIELSGQGKWQRKPAKLVDFSLGSFEASDL